MNQAKKLLLLLNLIKGLLFLLEGILFLSILWELSFSDRLYAQNFAIVIAIWLFVFSLIEFFFIYCGFKSGMLYIKLNRLLYSLITILSPVLLLIPSLVGLYFFEWLFYVPICISWMVLILLSPFILILIIIEIRKNKD